MSNGQSGIRQYTPPARSTAWARDGGTTIPDQNVVRQSGQSAGMPAELQYTRSGGTGGGPGTTRQRQRWKTVTSRRTVVPMEDRSQRSYKLQGSRRTGTYGQQSTQLRYTPPTCSTPGLGTSGAAEERRHWRRTRGRRSGYELHTAAALEKNQDATQQHRWRIGASKHRGRPEWMTLERTRSGGES